MKNKQTSGRVVKVDDIWPQA